MRLGRRARWEADAMSNASANPASGPAPPTASGGRLGAGAWLAELPYAAMLLGAFIGLALESATGRPAVLYWQILAPIYGLICILAGWARGEKRSSRTRLIWTQALHWLACI